MSTHTRTMNSPKLDPRNLRISLQIRFAFEVFLGDSSKSISSSTVSGSSSFIGSSIGISLCFLTFVFLDLPMIFSIGSFQRLPMNLWLCYDNKKMEPCNNVTGQAIMQCYGDTDYTIVLSLIYSIFKYLHF